MAPLIRPDSQAPVPVQKPISPGSFQHTMAPAQMLAQAGQSIQNFGQLMAKMKDEEDKLDNYLASSETGRIQDMAKLQYEQMIVQTPLGDREDAAEAIIQEAYAQNASIEYKGDMVAMSDKQFDVWADTFRAGAKRDLLKSKADATRTSLMVEIENAYESGDAMAIASAQFKFNELKGGLWPTEEIANDVFGDQAAKGQKAFDDNMKQVSKDSVAGMVKSGVFKDDNGILDTDAVEKKIREDYSMMGEAQVESLVDYAKTVGDQASETEKRVYDVRMGEIALDFAQKGEGLTVEYINRHLDPKEVDKIPKAHREDYVNT
ncbi:MAG: hypothetical protein ACYTFK_14655, partial [Planctomycetota bacterium]